MGGTRKASLNLVSDVFGSVMLLRLLRCGEKCRFSFRWFNFRIIHLSRPLSLSALFHCINHYNALRNEPSCSKGGIFSRPFAPVRCFQHRFFPRRFANCGPKVLWSKST